MKDFTILVYEDDDTWKDSFIFNMDAKMAVKGIKLKIVSRDNGDSIDEDLLCCANLIMIDHDLDGITGDEIIAYINGDPDYRESSIYYYSGGESLDQLEARAEKFACQIRCFTKEGDDLDNAVYALV